MVWKSTLFIVSDFALKFFAIQASKIVRTFHQFQSVMV